MNDETAVKRLKKMGLDVPSGVGALEYYNNIQQQMSSMSTGAVAMVTSGSLQNQAHATMVQGASKNETLGTYGATIDTAKAFSVARQDGVVAAETVNQTADLRNMDATSKNGKKWDAKK